MPASPLATSLDADTQAALGQPVELPQIGRAFSKLWESTGGTQTRASLVNFAICGAGASSLAENTRLISNFTREHSCRALLLAHDAAAPGPKVQAWINAHCHLPRAGAKQVCCEQITFLIEGGSTQLLANVLFAHLDSDLPLYLWWQGALPAEMNEQLWSWVDRLLFDSREWANSQEQFAILQSSLAGASSRLILCDLNWTRTLHLRQAVAQMFDHPENLAQLPHLQRLRLVHAPGFHSTALLFAAWIAAQMRWTFKSRRPGALIFGGPDHPEVEVVLEEAEGAPVSRCEFIAPDAAVTLQREPASRFWRAEVRLQEGATYNHLLPAGGDDLGCLVDEEVTLGGRHRVYLKALAAAEPLF